MKKSILFLAGVVLTFGTLQPVSAAVPVKGGALGLQTLQRFIQTQKGSVDTLNYLLYVPEGYPRAIENLRRLSYFFTTPVRAAMVTGPSFEKMRFPISLTEADIFLLSWCLRCARPGCHGQGGKLWTRSME